MKDIIKSFTGWLHCVREPHKYLGGIHPRLNLAESDLSFGAVEAHFPKNEVDMNEKEYDLAFINLGETQWHSDTKNWTLAIKCFEKLVVEIPGIKILIIGRKAPDYLADVI